MNSLSDLLKASGLTGERREPQTKAVRQLFLHAGQVHTAIEPTEITTVLGSCVAICIWDPVAGVGGMNHFMLPRDIGTQASTPRHAGHATNLLFEQLRLAGVDERRLQAKIFGGARILNIVTDPSHDLGAQNVAAARELLRAEGIPIVEEQTGGVEGRKLIYDTATGETTVKRVSRVAD